MTRIPRLRCWARRVRGAVAIETVIVLPLILLIAFASIELGFAWQRSREVNNATRSAARVASNLGDGRFADEEALLTLQAGVREVDSVAGVAIFKSATPDGVVPELCKTQSVNGVCNYYSGAAFAAITATSFGTDDGSCGGDPDAAWCPLNRQRDPESNPDYIGIWVRIEQDPITGIFPGSGSLLTIEDTAVMRAEPEVTL